MRRLTTRNPTLSDALLTGYGFPNCIQSAYVSNGPATYILTTFVSNGSGHWIPGPRFPRKLARLRRAARNSKRSEPLTRVTFRHPFLTEFCFFCKVTILTSNTSVQEPVSRFGPALWLQRQSCAESAAFEDSRLNLGSTPVHLGGPVQWVNQPMVHLVN
ncbi:hypothetical protein PIB30_081514 [Stylosanthes scabra]|uniref:Uncharacterized protein n=1 Tax=Stylosanthes scabra TaxID=79078 RepID=A0ABU6XR34_9FABA|nr:hypothetical protein [Stylosanthes scabra]